MNPVVAIDIDGTLADYHGHFLRFAADYLNQGNIPLLNGSHPDRMYKGDKSFSEYCRILFDISLDSYRQVKLAYRQGGMKRTMPILPCATEICSRVRAKEAELWLTTTRPYLSLDNVVPDTLEWLDRHEIAFDGLLFDEDKYTKLAERVDPVRVVAILDDLPEMYDSASYVFGNKIPVLVQGKFNESIHRPSALSLRDSITEVERRIDDWHAEYSIHQSDGGPARSSGSADERVPHLPKPRTGQRRSLA